ncbi:MAG: glycosyltransferase family 2 protein [Xanthobacteraceae bacterium]
MTSPRFSIVVPSKDEAESLPGILKEISTALAGDNFEIIVVDDGSTDDTAGVLQQLAEVQPFLRRLVHTQCCGKSAAITTGVRAARASLIATLDGDGQNDPCYLPALLALMAEPGVGLAAGQRIKHAHSHAKRIGSRFANGLRAWLLHDNTRDTACGLKAFRRDVFLSLPYFDTMHRFLPALVQHEGLAVRYLDVVDRDRQHGRSKYGVIDRAIVGAFDLIGVFWLIKRGRRGPQANEVFSNSD